MKGEQGSTTVPLARHVWVVYSGAFIAAVLLAFAASIAEAQGLQESRTAPVVRKLTFNGRSLTPDQQQVLEMLERYYGVRLPDQSYWYDNRSGAMGTWNGPAEAVLPPGLGFGGAMPANVSGGRTKVFVNGRELHPIDVARLGPAGSVVPGRYWLDANGDWGIEGGPRLGNLAASGQSQSGPQHRVYEPGELSRGGPGGIIVNPGGACTNTGCAYPGR